VTCSCLPSETLCWPSSSGRQPDPPVCVQFDMVPGLPVLETLAAAVRPMKLDFR